MATEKDIKAAFRSRAKTMHPDKSTGSNEAFIELRKAYDTLIDPVKRKNYDKSLRPLGTSPVQPQTPKQSTQSWKPEPEIKWESAKSNTVPEPEIRTEPVQPKKEYNAIFLSKVFVHIFVLTVLAVIEPFAWLWMDRSFYLHVDMTLNLNALLSVGLSAAITAFSVTILMYRFEITSIFILYKKLFGIKFTQAVVRLLSRKIPRVRSLAWLNYVSVGSIIAGALIILGTHYYGCVYNWNTILGLFFIIGGIMAHVRVVFGLYYLYTICILGFLFGILILFSGYWYIGIGFIISAVSFIIYTFNRRVWFY